MKINWSAFNIYVPTHIGTIIILIFSLFVTILVVNVGEKIISDAPDSKIFDSQKGAQKLLEM